MDNAEILEKLRTLMVETFDLPKESITPEARLVEDLDLDSLDAVDMVVKLEELTGQRVDEKTLRAMRTVGDVVTVIQAQLATKNSTNTA